MIALSRRAVVAGTAGLSLAPAVLAAPPALDAAQASGFAKVALSHVTREFPIVTGLNRFRPGEPLSQRANRPVFYGSFDWNRSIAAHWLLARLHRTHPGIPEATAIAAHFDATFTPEKIAAEVAYFTRPLTEGSGRVAGWPWLLALAEELTGTRWADIVAPLATDPARRFTDFLPKLRVPGRGGGIPFAMLTIEPYARRNAPALLERLVTHARGWYGAEIVGPKPVLGGEDSIPAEWAKAEVMRRVLPAAEFDAWLGRFLPVFPAILIDPIDTGDRKDLWLTLAADSHNLHRARYLRSLAAATSPDRAQIMRRAAERHLAASLPHINASYPATVTLPQLALLALEQA